jgi:hypothetical protein
LSFVRIVLVGMPRLLHEITKDAIAAHPWARVVAEYEAPVPLVHAVHECHAHVAVVGDGPDVEAQATALLAADRRTSVLAISRDGRETYLYELRPQRHALGEVSPERLVEAIRNAVTLPAET